VRLARPKKRWPRCPSPGAKSRRVQHQNPCECGCIGEPFALHLDRRAMP
jgi:hypothetical protein